MAASVKTIRQAIRETLADLLPPGPKTEALCKRVHCVATLRERERCEDFPTPQECADARHVLLQPDPVKVSLL